MKLKIGALLTIITEVMLPYLNGLELDADSELGTLRDALQEATKDDVVDHTIDEVIDDPQVAHLGLIVPVEAAHDGARSVRPPVQFGGVRSASVRAAPLLNEHGTLIRAALAAGAGWPAPDAGAD